MAGFLDLTSSSTLVKDALAKKPKISVKYNGYAYSSNGVA